MIPNGFSGLPEIGDSADYFINQGRDLSSFLFHSFGCPCQFQGPTNPGAHAAPASPFCSTRASAAGTNASNIVRAPAVGTCAACRAYYTAPIQKQKRNKPVQKVELYIKRSKKTCKNSMKTKPTVNLKALNRPIFPLGAAREYYSLKPEAHKMNEFIYFFIRVPPKFDGKKHHFFKRTAMIVSTSW